MELLRNHSHPSLALRELEHPIATGRLRSGSRLAEGSLAAGLDISREAPRGLAQGSLVRGQRNHGFFVRAMTVFSRDGTAAARLRRAHALAGLEPVVQLLAEYARVASRHAPMARES